MTIAQSDKQQAKAMLGLGNEAHQHEYNKLSYQAQQLADTVLARKWRQWQKFTDGLPIDPSDRFLVYSQLDEILRDARKGLDIALATTKNIYEAELSIARRALERSMRQALKTHKSLWSPHILQTQERIKELETIYQGLD